MLIIVPCVNSLSVGGSGLKHANTSVNALALVTPNLNLCVFQNQLASKKVPAVILELVDPITMAPIPQEILRVAWFSPCPVLCTDRLSRMVLDVQSTRS